MASRDAIRKTPLASPARGCMVARPKKKSADMTTKTKTIFRVKLRLASFGPDGVTWQRLLVDRPSAEEASDLIKWAHKLDRENDIMRPYEQECSVDKRKVPDDGRGIPPLTDVIASLEQSFSLRKT